MILVPIVRRSGNVDLLIVLGDDNIDRIKQYDQAEVIWSQMPPDYSMRRPHTIAVGYLTPSEHAEIERMATRNDPDWKEKCLSMVTRGFTFRPEAGDHDFGPTVLGKPTEGTKQ